MKIWRFSSRLGLHLPYAIDTIKSSAEWNSTEACLTVTTRLNREYDFVNF